MKTQEILVQVMAERNRQDALWGEQNHKDGTGSPGYKEESAFFKSMCDEAAKQGTITYRHILQEEVYEAFAESDKSKLRAELIQVAAVAVAWVEKLDREQGK